LAWQAGVFWTQARPVALEVVADQRPDVAVVEHDQLARWARDLPRGLPAVLTAHNVTSRLFASRGLRIEAARHRRYAARHLPRYACVVAVSKGDARDLERLGARRVEVVPNGAPTDELVPSPDAPQPPTLLFTGSMDHAPNREGILWFAERAWPLVRERVPDARLVIVGRGPQEALRPLAADPSIELAGEVPAVAPYFEQATAVVAPLLSGGGTRIKILEALAAGRAVAATRIGAEGLELEGGRHLLEADGAQELAGAAEALLIDPELRQRLAREGRAAVERLYDWRVCGDRLERVLLSVSGRRG
jgi:glycosyltransferase involved in cell wall biosynthesis